MKDDLFKFLPKHWNSPPSSSNHPDLATAHVSNIAGGSAIKESTCNAGDPGLIPGSERPPGEVNPPQYSCLGNPIDTEVWQATVHRVTKESNRT